MKTKFRIILSFFRPKIYTECDLKITELFSYRIKQAWYYVSKLIFIQNRIHITQYNVLERLTNLFIDFLNSVFGMFFSTCVTAAWMSLLEVKRLKRLGIGGLEKIKHFYLSQHITLHSQNSIFFYLRTCPEWPGISIFSYPLVYPPTEVVSIFFSIFRDRTLISFSIPHLFPMVQILITLYIPQYLFLPRNEECSFKKYCVHFT